MKHHLLRTTLLFFAFVISSGALAQSNATDAKQGSSMTTTVNPIVIKSANLSSGVTLPYIAKE